MTVAAPTVYTVDEVAKILKVHPRTVYRALESGQLEGFRIGASWRVTQEALSAFVKGGQGEKHE